MPTLSQVVAQVRHRLAGVGSYSDQVGELTADIDEIATAVPVLGLEDPVPGVYEVGFEKLRVRSATAGALQTFSFGRGYDGTEAVAHAQGDMVTKDPVFSASAVLWEINNILGELYPDLYSVGVHEAADDDGNPVGYQYPYFLPSDAVGIIAVHAKSGDSWTRVDRYRWEPSAGNQLDVNVPTGTLLKVTYAQQPGRFSESPTGDEPWDGTTRLPDRLVSLVTLGVAARLAPFMDYARLGATGMEPRVDAGRQIGQGAALGRAFMQEFRAGVLREQQALYREHPVRIHSER